MSEIKIGRMVLGICTTNCYFLYREDSKRVIVIDPAEEGEQIYNGLAKHGFTIEAILLTHGHFDHIWGVKELKKLSGAIVYALEAEKALLEDAQVNLSARFGKAYTIVSDQYLKDGEVLSLADMTCKIIATPGHTVGGVSYYFEEAGILVCGDTLFLESVGRADFPTGSEGTLIRSIQEKLFVLPDETRVYPGHGDSTTIKHEKQYNPFVTIQSQENS